MKKFLYIIIPILILSCSKNSDHYSPPYVPRDSRFIITFNKDMTSSDYIELDTQDMTTQTIMNRYRMVWLSGDRDPNGYVNIIISNPTSIPGEQSAIDFYKVMTEDYDPADIYTISRNGNTVEIKFNNIDHRMQPTGENDFHMPSDVNYKSTYRYR